jgi:hypothetical protein
MLNVTDNLSIKGMIEFGRVWGLLDVPSQSPPSSCLIEANRVSLQGQGTASPCRALSAAGDLHQNAGLICHLDDRDSNNGIILDFHGRTVPHRSGLLCDADVDKWLPVLQTRANSLMHLRAKRRSFAASPLKSLVNG